MTQQPNAMTTPHPEAQARTFCDPKDCYNCGGLQNTDRILCQRCAELYHFEGGSMIKGGSIQRKVKPEAPEDLAAQIVDALRPTHLMSDRAEEVVRSVLADLHSEADFVAQVERADAAELEVEQLRACLAGSTQLSNAEEMLRYEWWLGHGCFGAALYGDDGEMQCNASTCRKDFKRDPLAGLQRHVTERRLATLGERVASSPTSQRSEK